MLLAKTTNNNDILHKLHEAEKDRDRAYEIIKFDEDIMFAARDTLRQLKSKIVTLENQLKDR